MVEIIVALITAIATITAAIIQYKATMNALAKDKLQGEESVVVESHEHETIKDMERRPQVASVSLHVFPNHIFWYFFGSLVVVVITIFGAINPDISVIVNTVAIIPVSSLLLALIFPIKPAYSPLFVTIATGAGYLGYAISGDFSKAFVPSDFPTILLIYVANVFVVLVVDYFRYRRK